jgi:hypothetical protein
MHGHTSLWALARQQQTYTELLAGLCAFHEIDLVEGPRGRMVRDVDCQLVCDLLFAWRSRPKLSYLSGRVPRRKPAHLRAPKLKRRRRAYGPKVPAA